MNRGIWRWAVVGWFACSLVAPQVEAADKATTSKKAQAKKDKSKRSASKETETAPKPPASKEPAPAQSPPAVASAPGAKTAVPSKVNAATPTPSVPAVKDQSAVTSVSAAEPVLPSAALNPVPIVTALANELAATRSYRRDANRERAWKLWGVATREPNNRAELERHARRLARLKQVLRLAKAEGKAATADRALNMIDQELLRHERTMNQALPQKATTGGAP